LIVAGYLKMTYKRLIMKFKCGQLVTVWVEDLDPINRKKYQGKYGIIKDIIETDQSRNKPMPSFISVFFADMNRSIEFIPERIRIVGEDNA